MQVKSSWGIAVRALRKNKLQTALTMTGMTIGVATVLTMIALGTGAEQSIQDQVQAAGMNLIIVTAGNWSRGQGSGNGGSMSAAYHPATDKPHLSYATYDPSQTARLVRVQGEGDTSGSTYMKLGRPGDMVTGRGAATTMNEADVEAIRNTKGVQYASAGIHDNVHILYNGTSTLTSLHGDDSVLPKIRRSWTFPKGRFYNTKEEKEGANVVVLGQFLSDHIFGKGVSPIGKEIEMKGEKFKVIGVIGSGSWMTTPAAGDDQFDAAYTPVTVMERLMNQHYFSMVAVTAKSTGEVDHVERALTETLRKRHNIGDNDPDDFTVKGEAHKTMAHGMRPDVASAVMGNSAQLEKLTLDQLGKTLDHASATMTALLTSIAAVSLVVGGIGVMNIMLLSVSQRTREIGIRRAIGARSQDVLTQFLLEATTLSVVGGLLGIAVGYFISASIARTVQWSTSISIPAVAISFGISAAIGIFFGYYPAREASRILPIQALKYE
jgi:putative ABC transport system permease protein